MTAPNIDMIAASLRSCSLGSRGRGGADEASPPPPPPPPDHLVEESDESAGGVTVDLNSEAAALPHHWEQCVDILSGEIYYINWENGVRTTKDPRNASAAAAAYSSSYYYYYSDDDDAASSDEYSCASHIDSGDDDYGDDGDDDGSDTADSSSSLSSASPPSGGGGHVLVAAGCKSCFMYFMVPKRVDACPKCGGGGLLHLGRNGCV